jgi:hypothetical protein
MYEHLSLFPANMLSALRVSPLRFAGVRLASSITMDGSGRLIVPSDPIIPFIEGDGTGPDIWKASQYVLDGAVAKAYHGKRKIAWLEVLAGEKAFRKTGAYEQAFLSFFFFVRLPSGLIFCVKRQLAADGDVGCVSQVPCGHQGPAHHARRRWHSLPQRCPAPGAGPLRLPAPRPLLCREFFCKGGWWFFFFCAACL